MSSTNGGYYLPQPSGWPLIGSLGLFLTTLGFAFSLPVDGSTVCPAEGCASLNNWKWVMFAGMAVIAFMMYGWFSTVVRESEGGQYNAQVDRSFRMSMGWFIFSEVMFFAAFFGALFYIRVIMLPQLNGTETNEAQSFTHLWLYSHFKDVWPIGKPGLANSEGSIIGGLVLADGVDKVVKGKSFASMHAWWIPTLNTALLITSSVTVTIAHHALRAGHRSKLNLWLLITIILGFIFVGFQAFEYYEGYHKYNLTLQGGAYGTTFYMLTGFHGLHVTIGATMLLFILFRCLKGHFTAERHFGFEAAAWYWHFVDVVWIGLFIFVYIL
jgi:cytochrome c oxidase subunit 3